MPTSMLVNFLLMGVVVGIVIVIMVLAMQRPKPEHREHANSDDMTRFTIPKLVEYVRRTLNDIVHGNLYDLGLDEEDLGRRQRKIDELRKALKNCNTGNYNEKLYVKNYIYDLLSKNYGFNEQNVNWVIPFDETDARRQLTTADKFAILLYVYSKRHGRRAMEALISEYELDKPRRDKNDPNVYKYAISALDIHKIYKREVDNLSFEDKMWIITQYVYQNYKGFGVIDELLDMDIDGISGGVSGVPMEYTRYMGDMDLFTEAEYAKDSYNSIWIFYKGKSIHLSFLSFESERELRRVCQNLYKYNNPGQLSETRGYIVNDRYDRSRVVVVRPKFAESWAFFVRKFHLPNMTLDALITHENANVVIELLKFIMKGCQVTAITGEQGAGKTSLMMALVRHIDPSFNLRVQEMTFELNLRHLYPDRNILSFRETETISGQEGLDLSKKTDGSVNLIGEVATDPVAAWMIQVGQVGSKFTVFSHHAKTFRDLVHSLRNSLLKTGMFSNEKIAEQQVVNVLNFDVHLVRDYEGNRYIERITECVPIDQTSTYPTDWVDKPSTEEKMDAFMRTMAEFFTRMTDRPTFIGRDIIRFEGGRYVVVNPISEETRRRMMQSMSAKDREEFERFMGLEIWGNPA